MPKPRLTLHPVPQTAGRASETGLVSAVARGFNERASAGGGDAEIRGQVGVPEPVEANRIPRPLSGFVPPFRFYEWAVTRTRALASRHSTLIHSQ